MIADQNLSYREIDQFSRVLQKDHNTKTNFEIWGFSISHLFSSGLSSKRIILSPFTKEFRGEGHSYEYLIFLKLYTGQLSKKPFNVQVSVILDYSRNRFRAITGTDHMLGFI